MLVYFINGLWLTVSYITDSIVQLPADSEASESDAAAL